MKALPALLALSSVVLADPPEPKFRAEEIDRIQIGYGLAIADVDGDKRPDILLADKKQIVWYQNPGQAPPGAQTFAPFVWRKHVMAENLTKNDNVCIAAQDLDGDGKCEVAVGAEWNPGDTVNSGAVFYLIAPEDRTKAWEPVKFPSVEPTTHRMKWIQLTEKEWGLVVVPLHGRGNKNAEGEAVKVLCYRKPEDVRAEWKADLVMQELHAMHNFDLAKSDDGKSAPEARLGAGGREGVVGARLKDGKWITRHVLKNEGAADGCRGIGELRGGRLDSRTEFLATIEPMHGNELAVYFADRTPESGTKVRRKSLTTELNEGHALATADVLGTGSMQIVVGFRGNPQKAAPVGIRLWTALDNTGEKWRESIIDDGGMACEDLLVADLNDDGKPEIIAAGRATKNVKIYWNDTGK